MLVRDRAKRTLYWPFLSCSPCCCALSSSDWVRHDLTAEHADRREIDCQRWAAREASLRAQGFYRPGTAGTDLPSGADLVRGRWIAAAITCSTRRGPRISACTPRGTSARPRTDAR